MTFIEAYRSKYQNDPRTDDEIRREYEGKYGRDTLVRAGFDEYQEAVAPEPDWEALERYNRLADASLLGELGAGIKHGLYGLGLQGLNVIATGAELAGEPVMRDRAIEEWKSLRESAQQVQPRAVESFTDIRSPRQAALWATRTVGEFAPMIGTGVAISLAGRPIGAALGGPIGAVVGKGKAGAAVGATLAATLPDILYNLALTGNFAELVSEGVDPTTAMKAQWPNAGAAALLALAQIRAGAKAMKNLAKAGLDPATETGKTAVQSIVNRTLETGPAHTLLGTGGILAMEGGRILSEAYAMPEKEWSTEEIWHRLVEAAASGALISGGLTAFDVGTYALGQKTRRGAFPPLIRDEEISPAKELYGAGEVEPGIVPRGTSVPKGPEVIPPQPGEKIVLNQPVTKVDEPKLAGVARRAAIDKLSPEDTAYIQSLQGEALDTFNRFRAAFSVSEPAKPVEHAIQKPRAGGVPEIQRAEPVQPVVEAVRPLQGQEIAREQPEIAVPVVEKAKAEAPEAVGRLIAVEKPPVTGGLPHLSVSYDPNTRRILIDTPPVTLKGQSEQYKALSKLKRSTKGPAFPDAKYDSINKRWEFPAEAYDYIFGDTPDKGLALFRDYARPPLEQLEAIQKASGGVRAQAAPQIAPTPEPAATKGVPLADVGKATIDRTKLQELLDAGVPKPEAEERAKVQPEAATAVGEAPQVKVETPSIIPKRALDWADKVLKGEPGKMLAAEPVTFFAQYGVAITIKGVRLIELGVRNIVEWIAALFKVDKAKALELSKQKQVKDEYEFCKWVADRAKKTMTPERAMRLERISNLASESVRYGIGLMLRGVPKKKAIAYAVSYAARADTGLDLADAIRTGISEYSIPKAQAKEPPRAAYPQTARTKTDAAVDIATKVLSEDALIPLRYQYYVYRGLKKPMAMLKSVDPALYRSVEAGDITLEQAIATVGETRQAIAENLKRLMLKESVENADRAEQAGVPNAHPSDELVDETLRKAEDYRETISAARMRGQARIREGAKVQSLLENGVLVFTDEKGNRLSNEAVVELILKGDIVLEPDIQTSAGYGAEADRACRRYAELLSMPDDELVKLAEKYKTPVFWDVDELITETGRVLQLRLQNNRREDLIKVIQSYVPGLVVGDEFTSADLIGLILTYNKGKMLNMPYDDMLAYANTVADIPTTRYKGFVARDVAAVDWYYLQRADDLAKKTYGELIKDTLAVSSIGQEPVPVTSLIKEGETVTAEELRKRILDYETEHQPPGIWHIGRVALAWKSPIEIDSIVQKYLAGYDIYRTQAEAQARTAAKAKRIRYLESRGEGKTLNIKRRLQKYKAMQKAGQEIPVKELESLARDVTAAIQSSRFSTSRRATMEDAAMQRIYRETVSPDELDTGEPRYSLFDISDIVGHDGTKMVSRIGDTPIYRVDVDPKTGESYIVGLSTKTTARANVEYLLFAGQQIVGERGNSVDLSTLPYRDVTLRPPEYAGGKRIEFKARIYKAPGRYKVIGATPHVTCANVGRLFGSSWNYAAHEYPKLQSALASKVVASAVGCDGNIYLLPVTYDKAYRLGSRQFTDAMSSYIPIESFTLKKEHPIRRFIDEHGQEKDAVKIGNWNDYKDWRGTFDKAQEDIESRKIAAGLSGGKQTIAIFGDQVLNLPERGILDESLIEARAYEEAQADAAQQAAILGREVSVTVEEKIAQQPASDYEIAVATAFAEEEPTRLVEGAIEIATRDLWDAVTSYYKEKKPTSYDMSHIVGVMLPTETASFTRQLIWRRLAQEYAAGLIGYKHGRFTPEPSGELPTLSRTPKGRAELNQRNRVLAELELAFNYEVGRRVKEVIEQARHEYGKDVFSIKPTPETAKFVQDRLENVLMPQDRLAEAAKAKAEMDTAVKQSQPVAAQAPAQPQVRTERISLPKSMEVTGVQRESVDYFQRITAADGRKPSAYNTDWYAPPDEVINKLRRGINTLAARGFSVDLFLKELPPEWKHGLPEGTKGVAIPSMRAIALALEDFHAPTPADYVRFLHECVHHVFEDLPANIREQIHKAIDDVSYISLGIKEEPAPWKTGRSDIAGENFTQAVAERLARSGFDPGNSTMWAERLWNWVKDVSMRLYMAVQRSLGITPSADQAINYVKLRMERFLSGSPHAPDVVGELFALPPEYSISHFTTLEPGSIPHVDLKTGRWVWPDVLPDSADAAAYLWNKEVEQAPDRYPSVVTVVRGAPLAEAPVAKFKAEQVNAAWKKELELLTEAAGAAGVSVDTLIHEFGLHDPRLSSEEVINLHSTQPPELQPNWAKSIGSGTMSETAERYALLMAHGNLSKARSTISKRVGEAAELAEKKLPLRVVRKRVQLEKLTKMFDRADEMNDVMVEQTVDLIDEFNRTSREMEKSGEAKGELAQEIRDIEGGWSARVANEYQTTINDIWRRLVSRQGPNLFGIVDTMRRAGITLEGITGTQVRQWAEQLAQGPEAERFTQLAETNASGAPTRMAKSLCAIVAAFAKRNQLILDLMEHRVQEATDDKIAINQAIKDAAKGMTADTSKAIANIGKIKRGAHYAGRLVERVRLAKRDLDQYESLLKETEDSVEIGGKALKSLNETISRLEGQAGYTLGPVEVYDGAELPMPPSPNASDAEVLSGKRYIWNEKASNDKIMERYSEWLKNHPTKTGRAYDWVSKAKEAATAHMAYNMDFPSKLAMFSFALASIVDRLRMTGKKEALELADRFIRFNQEIKGKAYDINKLGLAVGVALSKLKKRTGLKMYDVNDTILQPMFRWMNANRLALDQKPIPRIRQEFSAYLRRNPSTSKFSTGPIFDAIMDVWSSNAEANKFFKDLAKEFGLEVLDTQTGETILRSPIGDSRLTFPAVASQHAKSVFARLKNLWSEPKIFARKTVLEGLAANRELELDRLRRLLDPQTMSDFVYPLLVERSLEGGLPLFSIPGAERRIHPLDAKAAFEASPKDFIGTVEKLYELSKARYPEEANGTLDEYIGQVTETLNAHWRMLSEAVGRYYKHDAFWGSPPAAPHQLMDARVADALPARFSNFMVYDQIANYYMLNQLAFHSAFGRDGSMLRGLLSQLTSRVTQEADYYRGALLKSAGDRKRAAEMLRNDAAAPAKPELMEASYNMEKKIRGFEKQIKDWVDSRNGMWHEWSLPMDILRQLVSLVIQSPKTVLTNFYSEFAPLLRYGISTSSARMVAYNWQETIKNALGSGFEWLGIKMLQEDERARLRKEIGYGTDTGYTTLDKLRASNAASEMQFLTMLETESAMAQKARKVIRAATALTQGRGKSKRIAKGEGLYPEVGFPLFPFGTANSIMSTGMIQGMLRSADIFMLKRIKYAKDAILRGEAPNWAAYERSFAPSEKAFQERFKAQLQDYGVRVNEQAEELAHAAIEGRPVKEPFTRRQYMGIASIAQNELILDANITNRPPEFFSNQILKAILPLWSWEFAWTNSINKAFRTAQGQYPAMKLGGKWHVNGGALWAGALGLASLVPVTMLWGILGDYYDRLVLGKASARKSMLDAQDIPELLASFIEASGNMATYGAYGDLLNGVMNFARSGDTKGISLDGRILAVKSLTGFMNALGNLYNQGGRTSYATFWRPLANAIGGSGFIQTEDVILRTLVYAGFEDPIKQLPLVKEELAFVRRMATENYLRAAGRVKGHEVTMPGGNFIPNSTRPWISDMVYAAVLDNPRDFWKAWNGAIKAAEAEGKDDPVDFVRSAFAMRNPIRRVFKTAPTQRELNEMISYVTGDAGKEVRTALNLYNKYQELVGARGYWGKKEQARKRYVPPLVRLQELRKRALLGWN